MARYSSTTEGGRECIRENFVLRVGVSSIVGFGIGREMKVSLEEFLMVFGGEVEFEL